MRLAAEEVIREHREQHRYDPRHPSAHAERAQHQVAARAHQREREQEEEVDQERRIGGEQREAADQQQAEVIGTLRVVEQLLGERRAQRRVGQIPAVVTDALNEHQIELGVVDRGVAQRNGQIAVPQAKRPRRTPTVSNATSAHSPANASAPRREPETERDSGAAGGSATGAMGLTAGSLAVIPAKRSLRRLASVRSRAPTSRSRSPRLPGSPAPVRPDPPRRTRDARRQAGTRR